MAQQPFNPEPSALRTARMLSYRTPRPTTSFPGPSPQHSTKLGLGVPRLGRAGGGGIPDSPTQPQTGPIMSPGAGRSDTVPMHVPSGSYVLPADVVSHMGEGNSMSGLKVAHMMFGPKPFGADSGPWGVPLGKGTQGKGPQAPAMPHANPRAPMAKATGMPTATPAGPAAHGGSVQGQTPATPIAASGGEYVIAPGEVKRRGGGDLTKGHKILDEFVLQQRAHHIKTLKGLPGPAQ
jgi:hypothetical protein